MGDRHRQVYGMSGGNKCHKKKKRKSDRDRSRVEIVKNVFCEGDQIEDKYKFLF